MQIPLAFPLAITGCGHPPYLLAEDEAWLRRCRVWVGLNRRAAKYAGDPVCREEYSAGDVYERALAGLAGGEFLSGVLPVDPSSEFLSSLVSMPLLWLFLGNAHPLGILLASLLITILSEGAVYMSSRVGVRQEIASLIIHRLGPPLQCHGGLISVYQIARREMQALDRRGPEPSIAASVGAFRILLWMSS